MENREAIASLKTLCNTCTMYPKCVNSKPECFQAIETAISALEKQERERWIPVTERLPEYEKEVLTCDDSGGMSVGYLYSPGFGHADRWHVDFTYSPVYHIVAWRPLPEPYTEEEA